MRGKIWFPQGGCTIDGRKFDPRVVGTRLDLGGKGFVSHPVNQTAPAIEFAPRYCICMRFSNILFRLSVPWAQRLCLLRGREGGGPRRFNIDPSPLPDRANGIIENFLETEREFCAANAWMQIYMCIPLNIIRKRRKARWVLVWKYSLYGD